MIASILNFPSNAVRAVGQKVWNMLPTSSARKIENFANNRSWATRTLAKASIPAAVGGALFYATTGPAGVVAAGVGAVITGRATGVTNLWTGMNLPREPKADLLETAHTLAIYESRCLKKNLAPSEPMPSTPTIGAPSINKAAQMRATDECLLAFIQNASIATTITAIHTGYLGLTIDPTVLPKIILEASLPDANLWDVYMKHLGTNLGTFQWIQAYVVFFLTYSLGIIPNSVKTFMMNVLKEGRNNFSDSSQTSHLDQVLRNVLDQTSSFLDVYNSATKEYANAERLEGDVDVYRRAAIERIDGKNLETLTQEFCTTLVDQFFPHIPFFETLKQYPLIGWAFTILDYLIGGIINWIGRAVLKCQLPGIAKQLIETGIDSTNPTNLPFSVALANALTQLFIELENTPQTIAETQFLQPEKLPAVIEKLLETLELNGSRENPLDTQDKIRAHLDRENSHFPFYARWSNAQRAILRETMLSSTNAFITYLSHNTEELFANVFSLLNTPFIETRQKTLTDYTNAMQALDRAAQKAFRKLIHEALEGVPIVGQREFYEQVYAQYKMATDTASHQLVRCQQALTNAHTTDAQIAAIDQYAQTLKSFTSNHTINQVPLAGPGVTSAFYESFYPFHKKLSALATQLLSLQHLLQQQQCHHIVSDYLAQIDTTLFRLSENPEEHLSAHQTASMLHQALENISATTSPFTPGHLQQIHLQIDALEAMLVAFDTNRHTKKQLEEQRTAQQRYEAPPWLTRAPSLAKIIKGPSEPEINQFLEANKQAQRETADQLQRTIRQCRMQIAPMIQKQTPLTLENSAELQRQIQKLHRQTKTLVTINQSIQPARVETYPFIRRFAHGEIAKRGTPIAIDFFQKVLRFLTMKDPYIASTRIGMQAMVAAYAQKQ